MKKIFLLLIILTIGISISHAQNPLIAFEDWRLGESGVLEPSNKVTYIYNEQGDPSIVNFEFWNGETKEYFFSSRTVYTYNASSLITKIENQVLNGDEAFRTFYQQDYIYVEECAVEKTTTSYLTNGQVRYTRTEYFEPITCRQDSSKTIYTSSFQSFNNDELKIYNYVGEAEIVDYYYKDTLDVFQPDPARQITTVYNEKGQRTSILNINLLTPLDQIGGYAEFVYDQNDNVIFEYSFDVFQDTMIPSITHRTEYIYNEDQQILKSSYFRSSVSGIETPDNTIEYEYSCDGLLKKRRHTSLPSFNFTERYYVHARGYDCKNESEIENLISIRPNFTQDFVLVQSEILRSAKSNIAIYDMSGRRIKLFTVSEGVENYYLNIGDLVPGNYIIHVFDNHQSAAERVLKI